MAKMFYTVDEAATKLGVSSEKVKEMAASGQLQEFRDRDKLVFKREQVDMLSGGSAHGEDAIPLADSGEMISLAAEDSKSGSGTGSGGTTKERSGISIFEGEESEELSDPSAQTQVTASVGGIPAMGGGDASGSGLLDLTREGDDTSLGANLLEDVYGDKAGSGSRAPANLGAGDTGGGGDQALFESQGVASDVGGGAAVGAGMMMVAAESYDGSWSGIAGGLAVAMILVLCLMMAIVVLGLTGATGAGLVAMLAANYWAVVGGMAGLAAIGAGVGWALGRKS